MVRKLYKNEFLALFKWIIPLNLLCLVVAIISRINLEYTDTDAGEIVSAIMAFVFMLSVIALITISFVIVVVRFYKNLLSNEGYLTFTVPVSTGTHIICKLLCGTSVLLMSFFMLGLSLTIVASKGFSYINFAEMKESLELAFAVDFSVVPLYRVVVLIVSYALYGLFALMNSILLVYAAMALGHRSRKNRVSWSVGWYFIISTARSVINSVINGFLSYGGEDATVYSETVYNGNEVIKIALDSLQLTATFGIIDAVIWGCVFLGITYYILTHKLNLE